MPTSMPREKKGAAPHTRAGRGYCVRPHANREEPDWLRLKIREMKRKCRETDVMIGETSDS